MKPTLLVREISSSSGVERSAMKGDGNDSNGVSVDRTKGFTKYHIRLTKTPGWYGVWDKNGKQKFEGDKRYVIKHLKKLKTRMGNVQLKSLIDVATKRKGKDIEFDVVESVSEGFEKYHLGNLLDSKLKKRLERAIKLWGGKIDAVGMDTIKFRLSSSDVKKLPMLLKKLDQSKNVWIGDKRKNNIWDRKMNINKLNEKRDYKKEYKKYGSSTKSKKYRAELNQYNRKKGTYGNGDGKDASHKGGKIVGFESQSKNRGRAEKSRLKKEGQKRDYETAYTTFYNAYKNFANASMDVAKESTKISGDKTDQKIILKNFKKHVIPFIGLMSSWNKGHQKNPHLDEGRKAIGDFHQIEFGIQQAIQGMRALQDKINDAPYNSKWGKISDMLYKKEVDFIKMLGRSIPQIRNVAKDKILESTDTFDYNDMVLEMIESNVMGDLRRWRKTDTVMENKDSYKILSKCNKWVDSYMNKCDKELKKLK